MNIPRLPRVLRDVRCGDVTALYVRDPVTVRIGPWLVPTARRAFLTGEARIAGRNLVWRPAGEWCGCAVVLER